MSYQQNELYRIQYGSSVELLLQQMGSRFRGSMMEGSHSGKQASPVDQYAATGYEKRTTKYAPIIPASADVDRRWLFPETFDSLPLLIDKYDNIRAIADPTSHYVRNTVYALGRAIDDQFISKFFGTNKTGEQGATSTSFGSGQAVLQTVGAAAATGLNVAKLKAAHKILLANEVDLDNDPIYIAINAKANDDLLKEPEVINDSYTSKRILDGDGRVKSWMGFNFIHSQRLVTDGTYTRLPVWAKSGVYLGVFDDIKTTLAQRHDIKGHPYQVDAEMTIDVTRLEEKKCVEIKITAS